MPIYASKPGPKAVTAEDAAVGRRVRSLRIERGFSQTVLAEAIGTTFQQVQKYEKGVNRISGARIMQIAAAFGVAPAAILGGQQIQITQSLGDRMTATHKGSKFAADYLKLEDDARNLLVNLAAWLLEVQERGK